MKAITLVFPHQLFKNHPALRPGQPVYLVEEFLFFRQYRFHKQKLVLHRASMKAYADHLQTNKYSVAFIETTDPTSDTRKLLPWLAGQSATHIHYADTVDDWLEKRLCKYAARNSIALVKYRSPNFLNNPADWDDFFAEKKTYFQTDFYIAQRIQRNILLDGQGKPLGGQWSFDALNRKRFPKTESIPVISFPPANAYVQEAIAYVKANFPSNYGDTNVFLFPVDFAAAEKWLDDFLENRFAKFGVYEDAMVAGQHFLHHSVLSPLLNTGLLDPATVIEKALDAAIAYEIPLNSLEGFIRQIMGWREFIRLLYVREGGRQRTCNYWNFSRKIPASFWQASTGILPVDTVIQKVLDTGYSHHIERLMVMGNFMLLCEFDPDDVHRWFMEMYVDSCDWVMVPNVYGMTQFADGGLMSTKPYISGSNYLMKMGDFKKGDWQQIWDGLFWRFLHVHRSFFKKNPRLGMLLNSLDKMDPLKRDAHLQHAERFLQSLDISNK